MALSNETGHHGTFQLPPDSTGKLASAVRHIHIAYDSGTIDFSRGDDIVGGSSGAEARIIGVGGVTAQGAIAVFQEDNTLSPGVFNPGFEVGEPLLVDGVQNAIVLEIKYFHTPATTLVGGDDPHSRLRIDRQGAAFFRFSEGAQQLDGFGLSRMTTPHQLASYTFQYDAVLGEFTDLTSGGSSTLTHVPTQSAVELSVGTGNGDYVTRTSDKFHLYQTGYGQLTEMTVACGDSGKTNVVRRWGYFYENDGIFFELDGTDLYVVQRSSTSGSAVDTRVLQDDWNGDKANGTGLSEFVIDVTKLQLYWMDLQWLGAGNTRFGVYTPEGERITLHVFQNAGNNPGPYMRTGSLPVRAEVVNTGATAGSSSLKIVCLTVKTEGDLVADLARRSQKNSVTSTAVTVGSGSDIPYVSFRSAQAVNGVTNRQISVPEAISVHVTGEPCVISLYGNSVLTGPSWAQQAFTAMEIDTSSTAMATPGHRLTGWFAGVGSHNFSFPSNFGVLGHSGVLKADGSFGDHFTLTVKSLTSGADTTVTLFVTWIDIV